MLKPKKKSKGKEDEAAAAEGAPAAAADPDALTLDGEGGAAPKKKLPLVMIGAVVAGVLILGLGGTTTMLLLKKPAPAAADAKDAKGKEAKGKKDDKKKDEKKDEKKEGGDAKKGPDPNAPVIRDGPDGVVFYTLPDVVANMQTADGRPSFLKLKLTLELPDHETAEVLTPNMPRLQDMFQVFMRELRPEDLAGSQGGYQLRMEVLRRVNLVIAPSKANAVLIEEMLVN